MGLSDLLGNGDHCIDSGKVALVKHESFNYSFLDLTDDVRWECTANPNHWA